MSTRCRLDVDEHNDIDDVDDVNKKEGVWCTHDIDLMSINIAMSTMSTI